MKYKMIRGKMSPNFGYPDGTHGQCHPKKIVVHHWGSDGSTWDGTVGWLCNPASGVSAQYVLQAGQVQQIVDEKDAAWHAGYRRNGVSDIWHNLNAIGIECNPRCSEGDRDTLAQLIADIWKRWGKMPVIGHRDVVATACPGRYYAHLDEIISRAEKYYSGGEPERPKIEVDGIWGYDTTLRTQEKLGVKWNDGIISNQYAAMLDRSILTSSIHTGGWNFIGSVSGVGSDTMKAIQKLVGAPADGIMGPETVRALQRFVGVTVDGIMGPETVRAWQRWLNK